MAPPRISLDKPMTVLQRPDNVSDEEWEEILEEYAEKHSHDIWDDVEQLRKLLNQDNRIEAMAHLKKSSRFGVNCTYYLKAKALFMRDTAGDFLTLLEHTYNKLKEEGYYDRREQEE